MSASDAFLGIRITTTMSTSKQVNFFNRVSTQVTIILFLAFALVIAVVFYIVDKQGNDNIRIESEKLIVQTGNSAVDIFPQILIES